MPHYNPDTDRPVNCPRQGLESDRQGQTDSQARGDSDCPLQAVARDPGPGSLVACQPPVVAGQQRSKLTPHGVPWPVLIWKTCQARALNRKPTKEADRKLKEMKLRILIEKKSNLVKCHHRRRKRLLLIENCEQRRRCLLQITWKGQSENSLFGTTKLLPSWIR